MNKIKYLIERVTKSQMDLNEELSESGHAIDCKLRSSLMIPKELKEGQKIKCLLELTIGEEKLTAPYIFIQLVVLFEIVQYTTAEELKENAESYCLKKAVEIMQKKVAGLTELHTGKPLDIPLTMPT